MTSTGPLALAGSGEYTPAMHATDAALLGAVGRPRPRVALIPTASGLEPGMPESWNKRGAAHFEALGASPMPLMITRREDCEDAAIVAGLEAADLFYFSGGNPQYVIECWRDTPAWAAVLARWQSGAAVAGCSAGAMMMSSHTVRVRDVSIGKPPGWTSGLGLVPLVAVLPHFDRMHHFLTDVLMKLLLSHRPAGVRVIGVDEDTALTGIAGTWRVSGRQTVTVYEADGRVSRYMSGDAVAL